MDKEQVTAVMKYLGKRGGKAYVRNHTPELVGDLLTEGRRASER